MSACIHSAIAPNMNRCINCGNVWTGERWEALATAKDVVSAHAADRKIQHGIGHLQWRDVDPKELLTVHEVSADIFAGWKYRALIEDSK